MTQFGIGFAFWVFFIFCIRAYDKRPDDTITTPEALHLATSMAYVFWGIGWALAWVADVIKLAVT
jgi:3-methyladenine DNA glycosylase AlkD